MSIADKITSIETHIGDIYDTLEVGGADLTNVNKNIVNINSQLKDRYLDYMNNGTQEIWDNWEKVTGEGTSLTLNNTEQAPIKMDLKSNTSQTGTPTPTSPIPVNIVSGNNEISVCGKNLNNGIDYKFYISGAGAQYRVSGNDAGLCIGVDGTSSYTISTTTTQARYRVACSNSLPSTTTQDCYNGVVKDGANNNTTINTSGYKYLLVNATDLSAIQIEKGSSATTYEAYQGNTYKVNLNQNILDLSYAKLGYSINGDTGEVAEFANNACGENYIAVQPNTKYTISSSKQIAFLRLSEYNSDKTHIQRTQGTSVYSYTITTTANTYYLRWSLNYNQATITQTILDSLDLQLYATDSVIELCKIGNYQDYFYKDSGKWYKYGAITKVKLSDLSWTSQTWGYQANTDLSNIVKPANTNAIATLLCNVYAACTPNNAYGLSGSVDHGITMYGNNIMVRETTITSLDNFNNMIANAYVYFLNIEATTTQITYQPLIDQLNLLEKAQSKENQTNISQVNNDLPFIISASALKKGN